MTDYELCFEPNVVWATHDEDGKRRELKWAPVYKKVHDAYYIELNKWDRKLNRFITGSRLEFGAGQNNVNVDFFEAMRMKRAAASQKAFSDAIPPEAHCSPHKKARKARRSDASVVAPIVVIDTPPIEFEGVTYETPDNTMKVGWDVGGETKVFVEFTKSNLAYIKAGILADIAADSKGRSNKNNKANGSSDSQGESPALASVLGHD